MIKDIIIYIQETILLWKLNQIEREFERGKFFKRIKR